MNIDSKKDPRAAYLKHRIEKFNEVSEELSKVMNEIHNTDYSQRFWRINLMIYINSIVGYEKQLSERYIEIAPAKVEFTGVNKKSSKEKIANLLRYYAKALATILNKNQIQRTINLNDKIIYGFHDMKLAEKELGVSIKPHYPFLIGTGDKKCREKANQIAERYQDLFYKNAIKQIPQFYIEFFNQTINNINVFQPEKKIFHVSFVDSPYIRLIISKYVENGSKLFYFQHGGFYGEQDYHKGYQQEVSIADKFFTWGWKINEKDEPFKAYRLKIFEDNYKKDTPKKFSCLISYPSIGNDNRELFETTTKYFLDNLDSEKYTKLLARPRIINKFANVRSQLSFIKNKNVVIDSGRTTMAKVVAKSNIVVQFIHPTSTFLECLYVDHPSVAILTNKYPTAIAKPFYDFFLEKKVFHKDIKSLVDHLNNNNLTDWWSELIEEPMYKSFKNTFLRQIKA